MSERILIILFFIKIIVVAFVAAFVVDFFVALVVDFVVAYVFAFIHEKVRSRSNSPVAIASNTSVSFTEIPYPLSRSNLSSWKNQIIRFIFFPAHASSQIRHIKQREKKN